MWSLPTLILASPATTSKTVIDDVIRSEIGFDGLLMSDDVSMNALSGDCAQRAGAIFAAGCDVTSTLQWRADGNGGGGLWSRQSFRATACAVQIRLCAAFWEPDDSDEAALRMEFEGLMAAS
jgi:beta-N-acetylhexosaminidase